MRAGECARMCVCVSVREKQRQMAQSCPRSSQREFCHHFRRRKLGFGQKGTFISTMLILSVFRNEKHLLVVEERMGRAVGKFPPRGARCYLSRASSLGKGAGRRGGLEADSYNTVSPACLGLGEKTGTLFHSKPLVMIPTLGTFQ